MNIENLFLMRHELLLIVFAMVVLFLEVSWGTKSKTPIINISIILFGIITLIGFVPAETGSLFGGSFVLDNIRIMMKNVLNIGVFIILLQASHWLRTDDLKTRISEFVILMVSTLIGMNFMISSGDFLMFYLGLELATIPIAALAAYDRLRNRSGEAGIKLILMSALSSGILLYGLSMIYGTTGSIYFDEVATRISGNGLQTMAFLFFFAGMGFKIAIVPFHLWTADVYEGAPVSVTSYLSVISKGAAIFIFTIVMFTVFKNLAAIWHNVLYASILLTITVGNLFALRQQNLKRFLAFSSISQAGFLLLGVIGGNQIGMASIVFYVLVYIFSNLAAFGVVGAISNITGKENIDDYNGLYHTNPKLSLVMLIGLFSLAGIPPVAGFFGKFFLFMAAAEKGLYILVLLAVINTIISLYYYLLVVRAMFLVKSDTAIPHFKNDTTTRISLLLCVAGIFVLGLASFFFEYIRELSFGM